jgi:hypothetical protein
LTTRAEGFDPFENLTFYYFVAFISSRVKFGHVLESFRLDIFLGYAQVCSEYVRVEKERGP